MNSLFNSIRLLHSNNMSPVNQKRLARLFKKTKKKFYLAGKSPTQLGLDFRSDLEQRPKSRHSSRLHIINTVLYQNLLDLINTNVISDELEELNVELIKVTMAGDFSACRVFWKASGDINEDKHIQELLNKYAGPVRHKLTQLRLIGFLPKVVFVKDKGEANRVEVERLLAVADLGPDEEEEDVTMETKYDKMDFILKPDRDTGSHPDSDLFNINHKELHSQIMKFKKKFPETEEKKDYKEFRLKKMNVRKYSKTEFYEYYDEDEDDEYVFEDENQDWKDEFKDLEDIKEK
uniref:Ribosome-binding factor A, mitochondrial-like n=1 Tax=Saccoglossus kowalevskii TaxID=10224 RepID=A0ABM0LWZ2_SACKO|nr:PREDICTED: putative ribosome-binding factor A, mitochondrial-like [Saccoglossus kowalevskii]